MSRPANYERNIFINCPFDNGYLPILRAITFAVACSKYTPRSSLEFTNAAESRLSKIVRIMASCKLAIHDISRTETTSVVDHTGKTIHVPRFNMPFECGLYYGALHLGSGVHKQKEALILDSEPYRLQKSMSDLAGSDAAIHSDSPDTAIQCVRDFLNGRDGTQLPGAKEFQDHYATFMAELKTGISGLKMSFDELLELRCWRDFTVAANAWLTVHPL